jgi:HPt (histidine-containing phosphotransfer) domain-containing protein
LTKSIKAGDVDEAFRAAHTMKGMCQNMAFTRLYQSSHDITETLRGKDLETAKAQINIVTKDYNRVLTGIYKLLEW